jgi:uncharacterized protein
MRGFDGVAALNIAVVGSGISGLSAAWLLSKRHKVTVFEQDSRVGGHSNTAVMELPGGPVPVDTGFIVYNPPAYPNLVALFGHLGVPDEASDMSLAVSLDGGTYEYSGAGLGGFLGQPANAFKPDHWRMAAGIARFFREAKAGPARTDESLGQFLARRRYSKAFIDRHLLPMAGAIWSSHPQDMLAYPAEAFFRFFVNHGLLQFSGRPKWRTVAGGSREYVKRLAADGRFDVRLDTPVKSIARRNGRIDIAGEAFDHAVIAAHSDQALRMLADPSADERELLGAIPYAPNRAVLHRDPSFMPKRRRLWSSWNVTGSHGGRITLTYWMNRLQKLATDEQIFVTLNPPREPANIHGAYDYAHPAFSGRALAAQKRLWTLQGERNTWFCGAWFGAGFHEDGLQAGLAVAEQLGGVERPWKLPDPSGRIHVQMPDTRWKAAAE